MARLSRRTRIIAVIGALSCSARWDWGSPCYVRLGCAHRSTEPPGDHRQNLRAYPNNPAARRAIKL